MKTCYVDTIVEYDEASKLFTASNLLWDVISHGKTYDEACIKLKEVVDLFLEYASDQEILDRIKAARNGTVKRPKE